MNLIDSHDQKETRCPMLGHGVPFHYCRQLQQSIPCSRILNCWFESFDVQAFILNHFSHQQIKAMMTPPKSKLSSLLELIAQAKS